MTEFAQSHVLRCVLPVMVTPWPAASDATCSSTKNSSPVSTGSMALSLSYYITKTHTPLMPKSFSAIAAGHTLRKHSNISGSLYAQRTTRRDAVTRTCRISPGFTGTNTWFHVSHEESFGQVKGLCLSQQEKQVPSRPDMQIQPTSLCTYMCREKHRVIKQNL